MFFSKNVIIVMNKLLKDILEPIITVLLWTFVTILPIRFLYGFYEYLKYGIWNKIPVCYFEDTLCKSSWIGLNEILQTIDFSFIVFGVSLILFWIFITINEDL
jgi:hypothetical protein